MRDTNACLNSLSRALRKYACEGAGKDYLCTMKRGVQLTTVLGGIDIRHFGDQFSIQPPTYHFRPWEHSIPATLTTNRDKKREIDEVENL
jgi:hypothetical protein